MYVFNLKDYHSIKEAVIKIDGITVLAGVNGSGKSTLSRWLYYLVNAMHNFELYQRKYFINSLIQEVDKLQRAFMASPKYGAYTVVKKQLMEFCASEELYSTELHKVYLSFMNKLESDLSEYMKENTHSGRLLRFLLGEEFKNIKDDQEVLNTVLKRCKETYDKGHEVYLDRINTYRRKDLANVVSTEYSDGEQIPANVILTEGETSLLESTTFTPPLMLSRVIYVDTPMAVSSRNPISNGNNTWNSFAKFLYDVNPRRMTLSIDKLDFQIQTVIGGSIKLKDDKFGYSREIRFDSKEQGIDIPIDDAATGVKTFAYMSQLLHNGWLDKETLLLIDEPEAHLHPQWIVEFARLLVKIHKELGVKILIASHNPDMIAAIQSIAMKECVIDHTVFYLAEKEKDETKYVFSDKGTEIGDIFSSFNIALARIEMYGSTNS